MEHYSNFWTFEIASLPNFPGHYLRKYGIRETSSSSKLHSCIQSQDCRPLQNIVKYYTKCMNPMKRMEQSRNVEKALDCDKNTCRPSFQGFRKFIWVILSKYELVPMQHYKLL